MRLVGSLVRAMVLVLLVVAVSEGEKKWANIALELPKLFDEVANISDAIANAIWTDNTNITFYIRARYQEKIVPQAIPQYNDTGRKTTSIGAYLKRFLDESERNLSLDNMTATVGIDPEYVVTHRRDRYFYPRIRVQINQIAEESPDSFDEWQKKAVYEANVALTHETEPIDVYLAVSNTLAFAYIKSALVNDDGQSYGSQSAPDTAILVDTTASKILQLIETCSCNRWGEWGEYYFYQLPTDKHCQQEDLNLGADCRRSRSCSEFKSEEQYEKKYCQQVQIEKVNGAFYCNEACLKMKPTLGDCNATCKQPKGTRKSVIEFDFPNICCEQAFQILGYKNRSKPTWHPCDVADDACTVEETAIGDSALYAVLGITLLIIALLLFIGGGLIVYFFYLKPRRERIEERKKMAKTRKATKLKVVVVEAPKAESPAPATGNVKAV